jgi:hypothetical protein
VVVHETHAAVDRSAPRERDPQEQVGRRFFEKSILGRSGINQVEAVWFWSRGSGHVKGDPTMTLTTRTHTSRALLRWVATRALVVGFVILSTLLVPSLAQASSPASSPLQGRHVAKIARTSSVCGKVSAAQVSALIGYKVPAGTFSSFKVKPTKENFEISGTDTTCTYGAETSMATILKAVTLTYETISKPLTPTQMQESLAKTSSVAHFTFSTYNGLGVQAFYFKLTEEGITGQGITGVKNGTTFFGASVESKSVSESTIAALAKLAEDL